VERLFIASIAEAEHSIYIENQFLSSIPVADALARRLREKPELEVLIVAPATHASWLEARSMRNGRIRFMRRLSDKDIASRVRLLHPQVSDGANSANVMVHSKVMIIDDRILRIGSANLNNRSMGTDTECDLMIVANNKAERRQIAKVRDRLLADHCGCTEDEVACAMAKEQSLLRIADTLSCNGHRLIPIDDGVADTDEISAYIEGVADPERPIGAEEFVSSLLGGAVPRRQLSTVMKVFLAALGVLVLALIWEYSPVSTLVNPRAVAGALGEFARGPWGPLVVVFAFIGGGLVIFPVTVLIAATAATFGPWLGFAYAVVGTILSALVTYGLGAMVGKKTLRDLLGPKLNRIRRKIAKKGVIAVAAIRMVPLAPFTVVNMVAGASEISLSQYLIGTLIGMMPGIFVMSVLGHQLSQIILQPDAKSLALLAAAVVGWLVVSIGLQALVSRFGSVTS
ncbi:MAG: VTT domain-containing protein, partial [Pseudolabrys sp.]|nr:VTT domain-containing protein [Pseudolabrys sp.]